MPSSAISSGALSEDPSAGTRWFFFSDIESTRQRQEQVICQHTADRRDCAPATSRAAKPSPDPLSGVAFPNNIIPTNRISPQAKFFLPYMPTQVQGKFNAPQSLDIYKGDVKIDAALTQSDHLMGRYSIADDLESDPNQYPSLGIQGLHSRAQNAVLNWTRIFSSQWLSEFRVGYYRDYFLFDAVLPGTNFLQQAGITGFEKTQLDPSFPADLPLRLHRIQRVRQSNNLPKANRIRTWQFNEAISYSTGKHNMKFGAQLYHQTHGFFNGQSQEGNFSFSTNYTGDAFSDFLLGYPTSVYRAYPLSLYGNYASQWAAFWQDTYRVNDKLTLNLGFRWSYNPFFYGIGGQTSAIDYPTGKIVVPMRDGKLINGTAQPEIPLLLPLFSDRVISTEALGLPESIRKTGPGQFTPRFGFAWRPNSRVVLRGAYGIFDVYLDTNLTLQWAKVPPFEITQTVNNSLNSSTHTMGFNWADPFMGQPLASANPNPGKACATSNMVLASCIAPNVYSAPGDLQHTYMQQWNLAVQTQLSKGPVRRDGLRRQQDHPRPAHQRSR